MATERKYLSFDKLSLYDEKIKKVISDGDAATLQSAKDYSDSLASNYDAAGSAASAEAAAKEYADGKDAAIAAAQKAGDDAAAAAKAADDKAVAAQGEVDALEEIVAELDAYVGDIPEGYTEENIVAFIQKRAQEVLDSATGGSSESAASVLAALNAYKAELNPKVEANATAASEAKSAADAAQGYAEGVADDLAEAVEALEGADADQVERIAALEGTIVGLSGAMHFKGVKDEVPTDVTGYEQGDVIIVGNKEYVLNGSAFVEFGDASVNAEAITALTGKVTTAEGDIDALEGRMATAEGAIALKAEQSALEDAIEALEGADSAQVDRIKALEDKFGGAEGSVEDQIEEAKQAAIDTAAGDATSKADAALAAAKKYADEEDAKIESRVDALETDQHTHENKELLDTYTQTETDLADAVAKKHEHGNKAVLDGIDANAVAAWGAAEGNAKTYADGLNSAMDSRMSAVEGWQTNMKEISEDEINSLF